MTVRAVFFDAVGTLIEPDPPAPAVYLAVASRHGSRLSLPEVASRFRRSFTRQERLDREAGWQTSEARERARWEVIVREVLDDVRDLGACFNELYEHFARPEAWRLLEPAGEVLAELAGRGHTIGVASNFDSRLRTVLAGLPVGRLIHHVVISSEVGWRKPAVEFFRQLSAGSGYSPREVLLVGDDLDNDYRGARAAGCEAILLDPESRHEGVRSIRSLSELTDL